MFRQPQRTRTSAPVRALEVPPEPDGLLREAGVGRVEVVAAVRPRAPVGRGHRVADPAALEDDDPRAALRGVVGGEAAHHAAADDHEILDRGRHDATSTGPVGRITRAGASGRRFGARTVGSKAGATTWVNRFSEPIHHYTRRAPPGKAGAPRRGVRRRAPRRLSPVRYVALLRGINVGGRTLVKMADLKACFESSGSRTYRPTSRAATCSSRAAGTTPPGSPRRSRPPSSSGSSCR